MCIGNTNPIQRLKELKTPMYLTIQHWKGLQNELQPTPAPRQDQHSYFILLCSPACKYFGAHLSLSDHIAVFLRHMQTTEILQPSKVNASLPFSFNESKVSFFWGCTEHLLFAGSELLTRYIPCLMQPIPFHRTWQCVSLSFLSITENRKGKGKREKRNGKCHNTPSSCSAFSHSVII